MEVAKLGFTIDGEGARHDVELTTEQLRALANGGKEAARVMDELNASLGGGGGGGLVPPDVPPKIDRLAESLRRMREAASQRIAVDFSGQIAELDPFQAKLEQIQERGDQVRASLEKMRAAGRQKLDLGLSEQIAQLDPFQKGVEGIGQKAGFAGVGIGRLANQVTDLGAHLTGVHPIVGKVVEVVGQLAVGHALTLGVVAGITLIALAWDKFSESTRKATEAQNKLAQAARDATLAKALGPGGAAADQATAVQGRIKDLEDEIRIRGSFIESAKVGRAQEFSLNPAARAEDIDKLKQELTGYRVVLKGLMDDISSARIQNFVQSITAPFDYAQQRGQAIMGFYDELLAAQRQLNEEAKSGVVQTKTAALAGLQRVHEMLDQIRLQQKGFAEAPGQVYGIPTAKFGPAVTQTVQNLQANILDQATKRGADLTSYGTQIINLQGKLNQLLKDSAAAPESFKRAVGEAIDEARNLLDVWALASAVKAGGGAPEDVARNIREGAITPQGAANQAIINNAQQQRQYGIDLAVREAAVKLPDVFDAVREGALRLKEGFKDATRNLKLAIENFRPSNIVGGIKQGATQAGADILNQFSPANLAANLVSSAANYLISGIQDVITGFLDGGAAAREYARKMKALREELAAGIAQFTGNDLASQLQQNQLTADQLKKLAQDAYGSIGELLRTHGQAWRDLKDAIDTIGEAAARNAARIQRLAEQQQKNDLEDLRVRSLRAAGRTDEADTLAYRLEREREYQAALEKAMQDGIMTTAEQQYLAALKQVESAEILARAMGILNDAVRNAPTGFRPEDYGFGQNYYGPPAGGGTGIGGEGPPVGRLPLGGDSGIPSGRRPTGEPVSQSGRPAVPQGITIQVNIPEGGIVIRGEEAPQTIARKVLQGVTEFALSSVGGNVPISTAMEVMRFTPITQS